MGRPGEHVGVDVKAHRELGPEVGRGSEPQGHLRRSEGVYVCVYTYIYIYICIRIVFSITMNMCICV